MKKLLVLSMSLIMVLLIAGCGGAKDVDSRDKANSVLLSANSTVAECEKTMDDYETRMNTVKVKDLDAVEKRLDGVLVDIHSCDSYKDIEDVKPKYDKAMDYHGRAMTHLGQLRAQLEKLEEEK